MPDTFHQYDHDDMPAIGARVRHYVDGDTGTVLSISPGRYKHLPRVVDVRWDSDPDSSEPCFHFADELEAAD